MLLCGRIDLVAQFLEVSYPQILAHTDCVLAVHTLALLLAMDPLFTGCLGAVGECDGAI